MITSRTLTPGYCQFDGTPAELAAMFRTLTGSQFGVMSKDVTSQLLDNGTTALTFRRDRDGETETVVYFAANLTQGFHAWITALDHGFINRREAAMERHPAGKARA